MLRRCPHTPLHFWARIPLSWRLVLEDVMFKHAPMPTPDSYTQSLFDIGWKLKLFRKRMWEQFYFWSVQTMIIFHFPVKRFHSAFRLVLCTVLSPYALDIWSYIDQLLLQDISCLISIECLLSCKANEIFWYPFFNAYLVWCKWQLQHLGYITNISIFKQLKPVYAVRFLEPT